VWKKGRERIESGSGLFRLVHVKKGSPSAATTQGKQKGRVIEEQKKKRNQFMEGLGRDSRSKKTKAEGKIYIRLLQCGAIIPTPLMGGVLRGGLLQSRRRRGEALGIDSTSTLPWKSSIPQVQEG